ncbi:MAG TPA: radical SAM protein, partial [Candidatus Poseidoniales archaeon]|nr:radical SAM protein [Candidatus Poseidoniales archaeon]
MEGRKLVLFVTGRCHWKCDYCPLSNTRRESATMYANERACTTMDEVIEEARAMDASGTGITGGDPMMDKEASLAAIRALKGAFGDRHHIHLYTSLPVESAVIDDLSDAGLDELRFHPLDLDLSRYRSALAAASASGMAVGIELPAMPDQRQEMFALIETLRNTDVDFLNLNELELTVGNDEQMAVRGFNLGVASPAGAEG